MGKKVKHKDVRSRSNRRVVFRNSRISPLKFCTIFDLPPDRESCHDGVVYILLGAGKGVIKIFIDTDLAYVVYYKGVQKVFKRFTDACTRQSATNIPANLASYVNDILVTS